MATMMANRTPNTMPVIAPAESPSGELVVVGVTLVVEAVASLSQRLPVYSLGQLEERHHFTGS